MEYSKLVAVTGLPGLFELISSRADGAVVAGQLAVFDRNRAARTVPQERHVEL